LTKYVNIDSTTISFGVAPRINACGRMGFANIALDLLLEKDINKAEEIAQNINLYNNKRQSEEKRIFEEAQFQIQEKNLQNNDIIILGGKAWHHRSDWNRII